MPTDLKQAALDYHANPKPGKIAIEITKPTATQRDLSLAYTPGVAEPVRAIQLDRELAYRYTAKGNLVAVITNGTAVLGLGDTGALAGKPVMEGKVVLFKAFAGIDAFDIEVDTHDPDIFIDTVARIASGFGGINLEDIAAPHCFRIERELRERLDIPVFHDDQHGTAVIISAGLINALRIAGKRIEDARIVCLGAGAAGLASMHLLTTLGARREHILMVDRQGVIRADDQHANEYQRIFAAHTDRHTLAEACVGADVFVGVSGPNLLTAEMLSSMAENPIVFALANPDPEIDPSLALATRSDVIMATGRTDYPNQINNVLGFPYIFRGALDVHARSINDAMLTAAVHALADLAHQPVPDSVLKAYGLDALSFGRDYFIPKPFDPRLIDVVPAAIARAAADSGAARTAPGA
ncbi:malate dehydrogenase [Acidihalobacter aeolianus]|uniref:NADP-dependent malic enzyme n=1 Tax=Acidihalobacter aeolianus TaxID=2792603 RepID=A0A1D8K407_9GAMM|nr:malic enzyme-like NAD(P)-binding protein [Acidihalobacter aeolianus]AOV15693.1 malate dehydrogenase [Acidihalobacter aeolianus]